jgi:hypothetical protein
MTFLKGSGLVTQIWDSKNRDSASNEWRQHVKDYGSELLTFDRRGGGGKDAFNAYMSGKELKKGNTASNIWHDITHRHHLHLTVKGDK